MAQRQTTKQRKGAKAKAEELEMRRRPIRDLLSSASTLTPGGMVPLLEAIQKHVLLIDMADTPTGEKACVDRIAEELPDHPSSIHRDMAIMWCVQELCNYRRGIREQVLAAAIDEAKSLATKAKELKTQLPCLQKVFDNRHAREQALSHVEAVLSDVDNKINADFREKVLWPARGKGRECVAVLRKDPKLAELMAAYDRAIAIHDAY